MKKYKVVFAIFAAIIFSSLGIIGCGEEAQEGFPIIVDYDIPLGDMIKLGEYDINELSECLEEYPFARGDVSHLHGKDNVEIKLVYLPGVELLSEKENHLYEQGLRPANVAELLAFGAKYPGEQRKFPIIAIGTSLKDTEEIGQFFPTLWHNDEYGKRVVRTLAVSGYPDYVFFRGDEYYFAAVPLAYDYH